MKKLTFIIITALFFNSCKKDNQNVCENSPCQFQTININGYNYKFNVSRIIKKDGILEISFFNNIDQNYYEEIEFLNIPPNKTGFFILKKGSLIDPFPVVRYYYYDYDVPLDVSYPYDETSCTLEITKSNETGIQGNVDLSLYRYDPNNFPSTFYGDVDTLNIKFSFSVGY